MNFKMFKKGVVLGVTILAICALSVPVFSQIPGGSLDPGAVPKYVLPLVKPPAMPPSKSNKNKDKYNIAVRQFQQRILSPPHPVTTVWSYGSVDNPGTAVDPVTGALTGGTFNYPAFTIEAIWNKDVQVKWINDLVDANGNYLPHLLPVDQTLHWANPPGGNVGRDTRGTDPTSYTGPVPMITHVHGAHTMEDSDGYPEAWYLPAAINIPAGYATTGTYFDIFNTKYGHNWAPGTVSFKYPNDQRATTLWYHDHTLGMTRLNVYAGPAGFWLIRGGPDGDGAVLDSDTGLPAVLPGPAPGVGDSPLGTYYEIPIVIQDRSFNTDGSLFYPDNRAFFEGLNVQGTAGTVNEQFLNAPELQIPFIPDPAVGGTSDVSPIWQPEFFGNMMVVNGFTWPNLDVEKRRYRFRFLNGCNSRFLILDFSAIIDAGGEVWQIGAEGGFLEAPVNLANLAAPYSKRLLMGLAERADVIVDFTNVPNGEYVLGNLGPDEPFGGGTPYFGCDPDANPPVGPDDCFEPSDPGSTGQVMQFTVTGGDVYDPTTPPANLELPIITPLATLITRQISLNEEESKTVLVSEDLDGNVVLDPDGAPFGPTAALLGTLTPKDPNYPNALGRLWSDPITENPAVGATEQWEMYNFTADAHPIHIHLVQFQVNGREVIGGGVSIAGSNDPLPWETGFKDTVISYPGEITRVTATFDTAGLFVWHCHIVEHEDNEMMRPYQVGP